MWLNIAATRGDINAQAGAKRIYRRMSPANISKVRKLARDSVKLDFGGCSATPT